MEDPRLSLMRTCREEATKTAALTAKLTGVFLGIGGLATEAKYMTEAPDTRNVLDNIAEKTYWADGVGLTMTVIFGAAALAAQAKVKKLQNTGVQPNLEQHL